MNDALDAMSNRYADLGLVRLDEDEFLKLETESLIENLQMLSNQECNIDSVDYDFSLNIHKRCNAKSTLMADAKIIEKFFQKDSDCKEVVESLTRSYVQKLELFFGDSAVTCEVNLTSDFGEHSSAIGRIQGNVIIFDGIKYGEHERFMRATESGFPTSNDFSKPSYSCPTASNVLTGSKTLPRTTEENEDCLYLKITAPLEAFEFGADQRKVITWIHGGTFNFGGMDVVYEDPTALVGEQDLIVVKMNYRLGAFGNWFFPLRVDSQPKSNFAILDQRLAMKWVHDHISSFNGDAEDITLAGASAGGASVLIHLTHEDSYDFYKNAIVMSATTTPYWSEEDATTGYGYIASKLGCSSPETFQQNLMSGDLISCLQSIDINQFKATIIESGNIFGSIALSAGRLSQMEFTFAPNIDNETLTKIPRIAIQVTGHC